jgi:hypothetical protein
MNLRFCNFLPRLSQFISLLDHLTERRVFIILYYLDGSALI